jgi:pimeloyl-ACP methyl ester carboxylesterase
MASLARELQSDFGVLEPLQTALSVDGQIGELEQIILVAANAPVTIVGYSWGAWLGLMLAANKPMLVKKLILVASGAFEDRYVRQLFETRMSRLTDSEKREFEALMKELEDPQASDKDMLFRKFGTLFDRADWFEPIEDHRPAFDDVWIRHDIYQNVWPQAAARRTKGELLRLAKRVRCPVVAIHGDYDPTPSEGVAKPLSEHLEQFKFILIEKCGHTPWIEKHAREKFLQILTGELKKLFNA